MTSQPPRVTVPTFQAMKGSGKKISVLTAYDFPTAKIVDEAGIDAILVGDSLAMVVQGHETTLPVTLDEMIYHAKMVGRAAQRALVVVDMPFPLMHLGNQQAVAAAGRVLKETRCQAVKLEGGAEQADVIAALTSAGIPVMAHVGLRPQSVHQMGGYRVQRDEQRLMGDAQAAERAGAFSIVLECIPATLAARISSTLKIPTIGIGAGPDCDGQVLVIHDMLGLHSGYVPRHVKQYADLKTMMLDAVTRYRDDVSQGTFPGEQETFR